MAEVELKQESQDSKFNWLANNNEEVDLPTLVDDNTDKEDNKEDWNENKREEKINEMNTNLLEMAKGNFGAFLNQIWARMYSYYLDITDAVTDNGGKREDIKSETDKIDSIFAGVVKELAKSKPTAFLDYVGNCKSLFSDEELVNLISNAALTAKKPFFTHYIDNLADPDYGNISEGVLKQCIRNVVDKNPKEFLKSLSAEINFDFDKTQEVQYVADKYPNVFLENLIFIKWLPNLNIAQEVTEAIPKVSWKLFLENILKRPYILNTKWLNPAQAIMLAINTEEDANYFKENKKAFKDIFEDIYPEWENKTDWKAIEKDSKNTKDKTEPWIWWGDDTEPWIGWWK